MSRHQKPTVYLFINKDSASDSLSRSHGKDASAILSHVQSCRNQKNKQLHIFRVEAGTPESLSKRSGTPTPQSPWDHSVPFKQNSPWSSPSLSSETSSCSSRSVTLDPASSYEPGSPRTQSNEKPEVDELVDYFDSLCLTWRHQTEPRSHNHDLYHQIVSTEEFAGFSRRMAQGMNGDAMLACTAAKMATDTPSRRGEFEMKATKYMQSSLQYLREQLADAQTRTLTDRQILQEMLLHCVTNWYLQDITAAQTHHAAMGCFTGCLDVSRRSDGQLMGIINRCGLYITNSQREKKKQQQQQR